jgi:beta-glucosidase/6-phospho-beta-glucosidase/beta-galactosidase
MDVLADADVEEGTMPTPPLGTPHAAETRRLPFLVATGIECSAPRIRGGKRRDELLLTGHWDRVEEDLDLIRSLDIGWLRYGIPFHIVSRDPACLDWTWTDRAMSAMRERGIEPIVDLLHFAVPDDLDGFGDERLVARWLRFVHAFVERYPWVQAYTPVNEPFISAFFSARLGWWNERRRSDRAFVRALERIVTCAIEGSRIIREARPDAWVLHNDACEALLPEVPATARLAAFRHELRFVGLDLILGRPLGPEMRRWLLRQGMPAARLDWFAANASSDRSVVGLDYYEGNERLVAADGSERVGPRSGFAPLARAFHERYGLPVMLAETNITAERAVDWLDELWTDGLQLRAEGIPFVGFCWYSLTDQVDWDTCLREANDRVNSLGLVDLDRRMRPVGTAYASLARASLVAESIGAEETAAA